MANPLLLDIVQFLKDNNLVLGDGIDTFRDFQPEEPDRVVVLHEYSGSSAVQYDDLVNRSVQITTRSSSASEARAWALNIFKALKKDDSVVQFTDDRWGQVYLRQTPFKLAVDTHNRVVYVFNIGVTTTID